MRTRSAITIHFFLKFILSLLIILSIACSNDDDEDILTGDGEVEEVNGISEEDLENYEGDLGLRINTRSLVKKGYNPTKVSITTTATQGDYDQELDVDPFTKIAQLKLPVEDLSESEEDELKDGVGLEYEVYDESDNLLVSKSLSVVSFEENSNQLDVDASSLSFQQQELDFGDNIPYYLQLVDSDGSYSNKVVFDDPTSTFQQALSETETSFDPDDNYDKFLFEKLDDGDNTYAIYTLFLSKYLKIFSSSRKLNKTGFTHPSSDPNGLSDDFKFLIHKEPNGLYTIRGLQDNMPLRRTTEPIPSDPLNNQIVWHTKNTGDIQYFRIIALDIDWQSTELDTEYLQALMPKANTSFGFNSTLVNCGNGLLEQEVGVEESITTTYTSSFEETIGLSKRTTTNVDLTVGATAEASFFGTGGSVSAEVSTGLELSTEVTSESTVGTENTDSETTTLFSTRTVTVPSGSASLVYDAYQTYSNVKVPYVKRLRLQGTHTSTSESLTGNEIVTQLEMTNFTGTIYAIGSDFVEITIRGNMVLDNIVDTKTEVRDVPPNCN
ncbi:MAG: hypothetical protein GVY05_05065 [Bacteroidetes bacterium]|jgi:hypothetical protein|nr:hypothetical protein [Bacteroidota bacterium]